MPTLVVELPEEVHKALERQGAETHQTPAQVIETMVMGSYRMSTQATGVVLHGADVDAAFAEAVHQLVAEAKQLVAELSPAERQALADALNAAMTEYLEDLKWERTLASPEGQAIAQRLAEEALEEEARGEMEDGGFDGR